MNCLIQFYQEQDWLKFRHDELDALLTFFGILPGDVYCKQDSDLQSPYLRITLPSEAIVQSICRRSILIKAIYEFWGEGESLSMLVESIKGFRSIYFNKEYSWCMGIDTHFRTLSMQDKQKYRLKFSEIPFEGKVELQNASCEVFLLMDFTTVPQDLKEFVEDPHVPCFLGRLLGKGGMRSELKKYGLKDRCYLGPTTLDVSLSFIMCNLAAVKRGSFVFDPFVGTASILVAATHLGAICFGADIDVRVLRGDMYAGKKELKHSIKRDIWETFKDYGLARPELFRLDNHMADR